ncbi:MAG: glucosaminidase domain-containing protein [Aestuariibacter sp.]
MYKSFRTRLWIATVTAIGCVSFLYPVFFPPLPPKVDEVEVADSVQPVPDFNRFKSVKKKKRAFFSYLRPEVEKQNKAILNQRSFVLAIRDRIQFSDQGIDANDPDLKRLRRIAKQYNVSSTELDERFFERLLRRVDIIPVPLVLVQAANESAWGTSRFARLGYNFFGMWCFRKGCGFVPKRRDDDMNHEVARYKSLPAGVKAYLNNLNRHYAYSDLRNIREVLRKSQQPITAELLAEGLLHYSERGQAYVDELQAMIRFNYKHMDIDKLENNNSGSVLFDCGTEQFC